MTNPVFRICL